MLLHTSLHVSDVEESVDFYGTLAGYEVVREFESDDGTPNVFVGDPESDAADPAALQFRPNGEPVDPGDFDHVALAVDSVDDAVDRVDASHLTDGPRDLPDLGVRVAFLDDPDGYGIELIETID